MSASECDLTEKAAAGLEKAGGAYAFAASISNLLDRLTSCCAVALTLAFAAMTSP